MQPTPQHFAYYFVLSSVFFTVLGVILHIPSVWSKHFTKLEHYKRVGEYGESNLKYQPFFLWKEPLNAATSLMYSVFGGVMILIGYHDLTHMSSSPSGNLMTRHGEFSIAYGLSTVYLGITSCLFHASHGEIWRKRDAGMTSGIMMVPMAFAFYDRLRPYGLIDDKASSFIMISCAYLMQFSLIYGYVPYGSSDIILPAMVISCHAIELLPIFGGAVHYDQYILWVECLIGAINGMLLRAIDINHVKAQKNAEKDNGAVSVSQILLCVHFLIIFIVANSILGSANMLLWMQFIFGLMVWRFPHMGHVCWHLSSSYALFIWWYQYKVRPGDPEDRSFGTIAPFLILGFVILKNAIRRILMMFPGSDTLKDRFLYLSEHIFFAFWGYTLIANNPDSSINFYYNANNVWTLPAFDTETFQLFYIAKVATHAEDLVMMVYSMTVDRNNADKHSDSRMKLHHIATALLCFTSYFSSYAKIGSLIMLLHDISDIPLDLLRLLRLLDWGKTLETCIYIITCISWLYWRLYYFPFFVLYTIVFHLNYSFVWQGEVASDLLSSFYHVPEKGPFLLLLIVLQALHVLWFKDLLVKGYNELFTRRAVINS